MQLFLDTAESVSIYSCNIWTLTKGILLKQNSTHVLKMDLYLGGTMTLMQFCMALFPPELKQRSGKYDWNLLEIAYAIWIKKHQNLYCDNLWVKNETGEDRGSFIHWLLVQWQVIFYWTQNYQVRLKQSTLLRHESNLTSLKWVQTALARIWNLFAESNF